MYRSKVCVEEFSYFVSGLDIQLEKSVLYAKKSVVYAKKSVAGLEICRVIYSFSSSNWYEPLAWGFKTGCRESGDIGSIPDECWNLLQRLGHFVWHWVRQCTDTRAFYIAALSIIFFPWISSVAIWRADRVVNLNTTIWLALFWRTWTRARASTRPHVLAWHMGRDYSNCRASELTDHQVSGFVFSWFLENTEKTLAL